MATTNISKLAVALVVAISIARPAWVDEPAGIPDGVPSLPGKVYTTSWFAGQIGVVDTETWKVAKTIKVGVHNHNVNISPDRKTAWVTNNNDGTVSVIDTGTDEVVKTIRVGKGPRHTYFSPDGAEAYITNEFDGTISVVDAQEGKEVAVLSTFGMPHFALVVGDKLFVTNFGNDHTCVFSRKDRKKDLCLIVGDGGLGANATKDGKLVVVACHLSNHVAVIDTESLKVVAKISTDPGPVQVTVTPNQKYAYVTNDGVGTVQKIDLATFQIVKTISIGEGAGSHGISFAADGDLLLVTNMGTSTLSIIDTKSDMVIHTVRVPTAPEGVAFLKK